MSDTVSKKSEIKLEVTLDENHMPVGMEWSASDNNMQGDCKAFLLNLWDAKEMNTMAMHLWIKDMPVNEMKMLFHQTLLTMSDTFERATGETAICEDLRDYCEHFAHKMGILGPVQN
jgi:gliding motility-associated protein GldC